MHEGDPVFAGGAAGPDLGQAVVGKGKLGLLVVSGAVYGHAGEAKGQELELQPVVVDVVFFDVEVLEVVALRPAASGAEHKEVSKGDLGIETGVHQAMPRRLRVEQDCWRRRSVRCSPWAAPCWAA